MSKKWELLDQRVQRTFDRAVKKKGKLSLATIVESQYYFPRKYSIEPHAIYDEADLLRKSA
ncbi:TPA: hypothetical protein ACX6SN_004218 [Photobacterium damselae]